MAATESTQDRNESILARQITDLWKQCLGESDVRAYLYQSILSSQPECGWLANNLEVMMYRYYFFDPDNPESEESYLQQSKKTGRGTMARDSGYRNLLDKQCFYTHQSLYPQETAIDEPLYNPDHPGSVVDYVTPGEREAAASLMVHTVQDMGLDTVARPTPEQLTELWNALMGDDPEHPTEEGPDSSGVIHEIGHRMLWDWEVHREYCREWNRRLVACVRQWIQGTNPEGNHCRIQNTVTGNLPPRATTTPNYLTLRLPELRQLLQDRGLGVSDSKPEMIARLVADDQSQHASQSGHCPAQHLMVVTLLAPTPVNKDSHYVTILLDKSGFRPTDPQSKVQAVMFDTGLGGGQGTDITIPAQCNGVVYDEPEPGDIGDTWENVDLNEAIRQISTLPEVNLVPPQKTPYPLQMDYNRYRDPDDRTTDPDEYKDAWCQTWSWMFGLLTLYPRIVTEIHRVLLDPGVGQERFNHEDCVQQLVQDNLAEDSLLAEIPEHCVGNIIGNYPWVIKYFQRISEIGVRLPDFNSIWLYAAIRVVIPHLQTYLTATQSTDRDPGAKRAGVSSLLYQETNKLLGDRDIPREVIKLMFGTDQFHTSSDFQALQHFNIQHLYDHVIYPINDINKTS